MLSVERIWHMHDSQGQILAMVFWFKFLKPCKWFQLRLASAGSCARAFAVKVATNRLPVFPFSGFELYHHFRNDAFYDLYTLLKVRKTGKREVVLLQPLPQTLYSFMLHVPPHPHRFRAKREQPQAF